ncbi:radical SAM protein [Candidatus Omnitrophota bacterium]
MIKLSGLRKDIRKPKHCCWVLNYRCVLRCKMCYIWNIDVDKAQETTLEEKKELVRSLHGVAEDNFEFHLSGGEPLMSEGVIELINFIGAEGHKTNMVTNGFLIDEGMARDIAASSLGSLTLSLDGMQASTHDYIRGMPGSHRRIMEAIDHLDRFRKDGTPTISIITTIMEHNLDEIIDLVEWAQADQRQEMISFQAVTQPLCEERDDLWYTREKNRIFWPQDTEKACRIMEKLRSLRLAGYKIGNQANHFRHFAEYFKDPNTFLKKLKCNLGDYEFHIDPYGKVFFCMLTDPIGNIKSEGIDRIWYAPGTQKIRRDVYDCRQNCHIMINCFYEDEAVTA